MIWLAVAASLASAVFSYLCWKALRSFVAAVRNPGGSAHSESDPMRTLDDP